MQCVKAYKYSVIRSSLDKKNRGEGAWEMSGSVREDDRPAVVHENKISKEVTVDSNSGKKRKIRRGG
jgi:hypothetical protein